MFGSKEKDTKATKSTSTSSLGALNTLVEGTIVEGTVTATSDIRIDGIIRGHLNCNAKVIIGETGLVEGQIACENAMIQGSFEGTIHVKGLLNVRETAKINGEVTTGKLIVESGSVFNVTCRMGNQSSNGTENTERKSAPQVKRLKKEAS